MKPNSHCSALITLQRKRTDTRKGEQAGKKASPSDTDTCVASILAVPVSLVESTYSFTFGSMAWAPILTANRDAFTPTWLGIGYKYILVL
jgi:hypothetical protein